MTGTETCSAVFFFKGNAGFALAAGIVVILRDGNDLQRRGGVMLLRQKVQYVFRADSEHLRICKAWLVRCAYAVVERQVFRVRFGIFPRFAKPAHGMAKPADIIHGVAHFRPQRPVLAAVQAVCHVFMGVTPLISRDFSKAEYRSPAAGAYDEMGRARPYHIILYFTGPFYFKY